MDRLANMCDQCTHGVWLAVILFPDIVSMPSLYYTDSVRSLLVYVIYQ